MLLAMSLHNLHMMSIPTSNSSRIDPAMMYITIANPYFFCKVNKKNDADKIYYANKD